MPEVQIKCLLRCQSNVYWNSSRKIQQKQGCAEDKIPWRKNWSNKSVFPILTGQTITTNPLLHPCKSRQRKITLLTRYYRSSSGDQMQRKFQFKKALIVTKLSRYEFEQHKNPKLTVLQLEKLLRDRGTDYDLLLHYHKIHKDFERKVAESFASFGIDVKCVNR